MHVGGDDGSLDGTVVGDLGGFLALRGTVADAGDDPAEGCCIFAQDGSTAVFSKPLSG